MEKSHFISMGLTELLHELLNNENARMGISDIQLHIDRNKENLKAMYFDLCNFVSNEIRIKNAGELIELGELIDPEITDSENELKLMFDVSRNYLKENEFTSYENEQGVRKVFIYIHTFNRELVRLNVNFDEFNNYWHELNFPGQYKPIKPKNTPITFEGLFNEKYLIRVDAFISYLKRNEIINETDELLKYPPKDFARIYYYLIEIGVIKQVYLYRSAGIKAFFRRFGVEVTENADSTKTSATRRNVTDDSAQNYELIESYIQTGLKKLFV